MQTHCLVYIRNITFLTNDISQNPQNLSAIESDLPDRVQSLVAGVTIDLDNPLSDRDE